jgi:hypothetical protein
MQSALERRGVFFLTEDGIMIPKSPRSTKEKKPLDNEALPLPKIRHARV